MDAHENGNFMEKLGSISPLLSSASYWHWSLRNGEKNPRICPGDFLGERSMDRVASTSGKLCLCRPVPVISPWKSSCETRLNSGELVFYCSFAIPQGLHLLVFAQTRILNSRQPCRLSPPHSGAYAFQPLSKSALVLRESSLWTTFPVCIMEKIWRSCLTGLPWLFYKPKQESSAQCLAHSKY